MQNWIATCTLPHKDCVVQSSIEATVPSPCFGKRCARSSLVKGKIDWTMTSLKIYWELSISPSSLFSESSLSDVLLSKERRWWVTKRMQKKVDCRRCVKAWLSWNMAGHISAPVSLEWFPPSFKNRLKRIDLGKMMIDLVFFFKRLGWTRSVGIYRMQMVDENKCARKAKLGYGWPTVSTCGSGMVPSKL